MLIELSIKDFAIIEGLTVSFGPGLNIFTGETGAGKSIIMDAIALILGDRATGDVIRASSEEAQVEAMFDVAGNPGIEGVLNEAGIGISESLVIKRVVQRAGRNRIYINGSLATLVTLTEVGRRLIDIYGQSEHQSLTRPEEHLEVLDAFGGLGPLRAQMSESYRGYLSLKKDLDGLMQDSSNLAGKRDLLVYQLKELTDASLRPGEDDELKKEYERLKNAERIKAAVEGSEQALYSETGSVIERLGAMVKSLRDAANFDERIKKPVESLEASLFQLEDAASFLRDFSSAMESDPDALEKAGERLDLLNRLRKKYGATVDEMLARQDSLEKELAGLSGCEERIKALEAGLKAAREKALSVAARLTESRGRAAAEFKKKIEEELKTLGMKGAVFDAVAEADKGPDGAPRLGEKGADRVTFLLSANSGEDMKPLSRIASGGELSRIMLAVKSVTAGGKVPTLIFDEIDTGVGGAMAQVVGLKLKTVSRAHQVFCITHLPQVAAFADRHYSVKKSASGARTVTTVKELEAGERIEEISAMLGGMSVTDTTRKQAAELVEAAKNLSTSKGQPKKKQAAP